MLSARKVAPYGDGELEPNGGRKLYQRIQQIEKKVDGIEKIEKKVDGIEKILKSAKLKIEDDVDNGDRENNSFLEKLERVPLLEKLERVPERDLTMLDVLNMMWKIYGYGIVMALWGSIHLLILGAFHWTDWSDPNNVGVPVLNKNVYYRDVHLFYYVEAMLWLFFINSSLWESGVQWKPQFAMVPYALAGGMAFFSTYSAFGLGMGLGLVHLGADLVFHGATFWVMYLIPGIFAVFADAFTRTRLFNYLESKRVDNKRKARKTMKNKEKLKIKQRKSSITELMLHEDTLKKSKGKIKRGGIIVQMISTLSILIMIVSVVYLVPIVVSEDTSDGVRIFIIVVVLGLLNEFVQLMVRVYMRFTDRVVITSQNMPFFLEFGIQFVRRILLGCMKEPTSAFIGLSLLSLEEAFMRGSLAERYFVFQ